MVVECAEWYSWSLSHQSISSGLTLPLPPHLIHDHLWKHHCPLHDNTDNWGVDTEREREREEREREKGGREREGEREGGGRKRNREGEQVWRRDYIRMNTAI